MNSVIIRKYTKRYENILFNLVCACEDKDYKKALMSAAQPLLGDGSKKNAYVAIVDSNAVGFVYGYAIDATLYPQFLYVDPRYRSQGIGGKMMEMLEQHSKCNTSLIYYNKELHEFYEKQTYLHGPDLEVAIKSICEVTSDETKI